MGASTWDYYVPYHPNFVAALDELRTQILLGGQLYRHGEWAPDRATMPTTEDELWQDEWAQRSGTHSILDVMRVIGAEESDDLGTVRPLTEGEIMRYLGGLRPTRPTFEAAFGRGGGDIADGPRWSAYCTVLYSDTGHPSEIAFWGFSGD